MSENTSTFDGSVFKATRHYDYPTPHTEQFELTVTQPDSPECVYWVACAGNVYALAVTVGKGQTCIANVDSIVAQAFGAVPFGKYTIWKPKNCSPAAWHRWAKKWAARTQAGTAY